jgi:UDP-N-acetylenolpyruvoylglucosamine reductase
VNGNAGSFFKNPVVSAERRKRCWRPSGHPHYPQADGSMKLAAGWLIDQCQLKGKPSAAQRCIQQALVLINQIRQPAKMWLSWLITYASRLVRSSMSGSAGGALYWRNG